MIFSPLGLSQWFNGFCTTPNSREIRVEQKPLNHRRKVGGEIITRSEIAVELTLCVLRALCVSTSSEGTGRDAGLTAHADAKAAETKTGLRELGLDDNVSST